MKKLIAAITLGVALALGGTVAANATEPVPITPPPAFVPYNTHLDWYAPSPATQAQPFAVAQHLTPVLTCGGIHQYDEYTITTQDMDTHFKALVATNTLNSAAEDAEFSPHNYTVTQLPDCAPVKPALRVEATPTDAKDCSSKLVTTTTTTSTWDQTLVNNVWVENQTPSIATATSTRPTTAVECPVAVVTNHVSAAPPTSSTLAYTGPDYELVPWGIAFLMLGAGFTILKLRGRRASV